MPFRKAKEKNTAVGQNLRYLFGDDYPPKVVHFKGFWDVHRGAGVLTHCHTSKKESASSSAPPTDFVIHSSDVVAPAWEPKR